MSKKVILTLVAVPVAVASLAVCGALITTVLCRATPTLPKETLPPRRNVVCMVDTTGSLPPSVHEAEKSLVVTRIIGNFGPSDYAYCVRLASRANGEFDEIADVLFVDDRNPEHFNPPRRTITDDDLCPSGWCDRSTAWRANYADEWRRIDLLRQKWSEGVRAAASPEQSCCSNYLKTIQYLGKVLAGLPGTEQKLLYIVGDLIEERNHRPFMPEAEAAKEDSKDGFAGVEVHLVSPSGHSDPGTAQAFLAFWMRYLEERGARVFHHTLGSFAGLAPSGAPRPRTEEPSSTRAALAAR